MRGMTAAGAAGFAERLRADVGERDLGGAAAVLRGITAPRHAGRVGVNEKQAEAAHLALAAGEPCEHNQLVCAVAIEHETFFATQQIAVAVLLRCRLDVERAPAGLWFRMRQRQPQLAAGDLGDQLGALGRRRAVAQRGARQHDAREIGLQRQGAAERLLRQHDLDGAAAVAAVLLGERRAQQAELGVLPPKLFAEAERARAVCLALLEAVFVLHQPRQIVGDQFLFVAEIEVHEIRALRSPWR